MSASHYLAFEGIEGAGKSSVAEAVAVQLSATRPVLAVREPGGTPVGEQIRQLVLDVRRSGEDPVSGQDTGKTPDEEAGQETGTYASDWELFSFSASILVELSAWAEALLFAAARAQLAASVIRPALEAGRWVVSDRSVYSSLAYQGIARGLGLAAVEAVNRAGLEGTWPELVVLLRIDPADGLARQRAVDRIGVEGVEFQAKVAVAFDRLAAAEPERFVVVEAGQPFDVVVKTVLESLERRLE